MRQPMCPSHVFGVVYRIDAEISETSVVFFANLDDRMSDFVTEYEGTVCL